MFKHRRLGRGGKEFWCYKFRSMVQDAEQQLQSSEALRAKFEAHYKIKDDPRVTRVGGLLRKTSLDELPQLLHVLAGQMSLVGPRTIHERELILYGKYAEKRHTVKPGMTGLWQISPDRHRCYEERIPLDMQYIDGGSLFLDFVILFKTLKVCVVSTGV